MTIMPVLAFFVSLVVTVVTGVLLVPALQRVNAGQSIREDGPVWHNYKQGTPTMGGVMFITGVTATCLTVGFGEMLNGEFRHIFILSFALLCGAIGFEDDRRKLINKRNLGLRGRHKLILQLIAAAFFVFLMRSTGSLSTNVYFPFLNVYLRLPEPVYYIFAIFAAAGTVNGVNLTDGADGLATGVTIPVASCFAAISVMWGFTSLGIFSLALCGGLISFLIFNFHPAKVFMGDTGAGFIGGAVCAMAFACDMPLILIPLGIIYFVETLSDIIQVTYFKLSHGKRIFKMAPLHHHLELCGWSERKLFTVFTSVSVVFAVISFYAAWLRN